MQKLEGKNSKGWNRIRSKVGTEKKAMDQRVESLFKAVQGFQWHGKVKYGPHFWRLDVRVYKNVPLAAMKLDFQINALVAPSFTT